MQGICRVCGEETSTKKTKRCYKCYRKQLWVKRSPRDKRVIADIVQEGLTAAKTARKRNISREMVRLILKDNGIDYADILTKRREKKQEKREAKIVKEKSRECKWCNAPFIVNRDGARVKYCSDKCYKARYKEMGRKRVREYYKTPKGQKALKRYKSKNKNKIKQYLKRWHKKKSSPMDKTS